MKITIYADRGHAWAKVNKALLNKLGIADQISRYSYMRGEKAYLEEDCDLSRLIKALTENNINFSFEERHTDKTSKIRSYSRYHN